MANIVPNANEYDGNSLWSCSSREGDRFVVSVYNGEATFTIFPPKKNGQSSNRSFLRIPMSRAGILFIIDILKELREAPAGTCRPFVRVEWDKQNKVQKQGCTLRFSKDEQKCYHIEVTDKNNAPIKFSLQCARTFSDGNSTSLTDEKKSDLELRVLINFLSTELPIHRANSRFGLASRKKISGYGSSDSYSNSGNKNYNNNYEKSSERQVDPMDDDLEY